MNRRDFFQLFLPTAPASRPAPPPNHFSMADIEHLVDEKFLYLIPQFRAGLAISIVDGFLEARDAEDLLVARLSLNDLEEQVVKEINGHHGIRRITLSVSKSAELPPIEVYPCVRDVFTRLMRQGLAHPAEPPGHA